MKAPKSKNSANTFPPISGKVHKQPDFSAFMDQVLGHVGEKPSGAGEKGKVDVIGFISTRRKKSKRTK